MRLQNLGYANTTVLEDISFTLPRRGLTAIVGVSGARKTTLARLLVRFWDPDTGRILLNGRDLRSLPAPVLADRIATVLQDDYLLDTSLGENIRLGSPGANEEELLQVLEATGLTEIVSALPGGLDEPVGPEVADSPAANGSASASHVHSSKPRHSRSWKRRLLPSIPRMLTSSAMPLTGSRSHGAFS